MIEWFTVGQMANGLINAMVLRVLLGFMPRSETRLRRRIVGFFDLEVVSLISKGWMGEFVVKIPSVSSNLSHHATKSIDWFERV